MPDDFAKPISISRRRFIAALAATPFLAAWSGTRDRRLPDLAGLETQSGGRLGVAALDLASGRTISHRGDERFAMCSTFKWLLAGLVLNKVDQGDESPDRRIAYSERDLVPYSPVTQPQAGQGGMTVAGLCSAAVTYSDNTAANLLVASLGGPAGFTARVRRFGDDTTRLDRLEPGLNENAPDDPRDTSSPLAMLGLMHRFLFGPMLTEQSRATLQGWMIACNTGLDRLRAGFPAGWIAGDKTGTSSNQVNNDVAFAISPENGSPVPGPLIVVSFMNTPDPFTPAANAIHASVAREVVRAVLDQD